MWLNLSRTFLEYRTNVGLYNVNISIVTGPNPVPADPTDFTVAPLHHINVYDIATM